MPANLNMIKMDPKSKIYVAGHRGLVGSAIVRALKAAGFENLILRTRKELNLLDQAATRKFFAEAQPEYVFLAAAKVGGIGANSLFQADFLYENLMIAANVIQSSSEGGVKKLLFLGSSCIYPKLAQQPMPETALLTGPLEPTNEGYAIAKIAGLKLCEMYAKQYGKNFISAMPTNLYGPEDNFHPDHSHVIPGMMRRFHEAKQKKDSTVRIWGTGAPIREFLYVDDLAEACLLLMDKYDSTETINVGTGQGITILELAHLMKKVTGFPGTIETDPSKPSGMPHKVLDVSRILKFGWAPRRPLEDGLKSAYQWALDHRVFEST